MFDNYEKLFNQIKIALLNIPDLRKLVFYNTKDALSLPAPTVEEAQTAFYVKPIIYIYADSPEYELNTFISIGIIEAIVLDGSIRASIKISVACDREVWELDNNRIRPLAILTEIANKLEGAKFATAGTLSLKVIKEVYFNNDIVGYTALFDVQDAKAGVVSEF